MGLPQLPTDKANHFVYGAIIAAAVAVPFGVGIGLATGCVAAVAKELVDAAMNWKATGDPMNGPHGVDPLDALATAAGSVAVAVPYLVKFF